MPQFALGVLIHPAFRGGIEGYGLESQARRLYSDDDRSSRDPSPSVFSMIS
ncbi:MAG: hypothetical protein K0S45_1737 [Nitrospira sp.]|jgi:hypothetical protein|nr:hypothetical protein [Nitrospira sp.]